MSEVDPFISSSASCAAGSPLHFAVICAQDGTAGVGDGEGEGEGLGDGLGLGEVDGEGEAEGDGEGWFTASDVVLPQAASTAMDTSASTPTLRLTGHSNEVAWAGVTVRTRDTGRQGYGLTGRSPPSQTKSVAYELLDGRALGVSGRAQGDEARVLAAALQEAGRVVELPPAIEEDRRVPGEGAEAHHLLPTHRVAGQLPHGGG